MDTTVALPVLEQIGQPLSSIPVGLKEAALDSPTFRATAVHFSDQVEIVERWLDGYVKSTGKLVHEVAALEDIVNSFLARAVPPANISEAIIDPDYTLLAMKRYGEGAREFWSNTILGMKKMESTIVEPIRALLQGELRNFKDARKYLDQTQRTFDGVLARFASQSRNKESSALREDAFQLHEARRAYLKASMDFCILAPQLRVTLDKLLVRLSAGQWQEMNKTRESVTATLGKWGNDMERVRGWSRELEAGERTIKRELFMARRQIEENAELSARPPRDLDYYTLSTTSGAKGPAPANLQSAIGSGLENAEKQGWLFVKTLTGKPTRTVWVRRWYFVRHGIFGWLVQGQRSGGVEESDRIGVLLCNVRAASQEERRFCFEVKTKDSTIVLQAETVGEISTWIASFEAAKRRALEDSSRNDSYADLSQSIDPAFAISAPIAPEFAAKSNENYGHGYQGSEDVSSAGIDRSTTLPVPGHNEVGNMASRTSFDVTAGRRSFVGDRDGEGSRDHAARIIQKLDLHRKSNASSQPPGSSLTSSPGTPGLPPSAGGIASLISASHNILPVYHNPVMTEPTPGIASRPTLTDLSQLGTGQTREPPHSTLAPSTLANPPSATNLSKAAVVVSGERGINMGRNDMPSGMMANLWGSNNWGYLNRLEKGEVKVIQDLRLSNLPSPVTKPVSDSNIPPNESRPLLLVTKSPSGSQSPSTPQDSNSKRHRKTISLDDDVARVQRSQVQRLQVVAEEFPSNYPIQLRTQEAQFRMLFPNASRNEKVVMVFRGTWNLNDAQEFPGRIYVTATDLYFYSHHLGLVLISGMSLSSIDEVTAAPGKDCDFLFVHLKEENSRIGYTRITIKIFLEPLRLLQRRLNFLIQNATSTPPLSLESLMRELINLEKDDKPHSPSFESWEDVSVNTPIDNSTPLGRTRSKTGDIHRRTAVRVDNSLYDDSARQHDKEIAKFRLPSNPVVYEPRGMDRLAVSREFDVSPKALFHVIFGDKSAVFQMLYQERRAQNIVQSPWRAADNGLLQRRFDYQIQYIDSFRQTRQVEVIDYQMIDVLNDHLCYSVTDTKTPWHLPFHQSFNLVTKITITYLAKSRCKLAIRTLVHWTSPPLLARSLVTAQALKDLSLDALDLADVCADQVRRLGPHSRTRKALMIFGHVGQMTEPLQLTAASINLSGVPTAKAARVARRTMIYMTIELSLSVLESCISTIVLGTMSVLRFGAKTLTANRLLLSILALSVAFNIWHQGAATNSWWQERAAIRYMTKLGVGPNPTMAKAVYLRDIEDLVTNHTGVSLRHAEASNQESSCYSTFLSVMGPTSSTFPPLSSSTSRSRHQFHNTRNSLARYRHDLLVGLRVVDAVEREVVQASWEDWIEAENRRCRGMQYLIQEQNDTGGDGDGGSGSDGQGDEAMNEVREWYKLYCGSCSLEFDKAFSRS